MSRPELNKYRSDFSVTKILDAPEFLIALQQNGTVSFTINHDDIEFIRYWGMNVAEMEVYLDGVK